MQQHNVDGFWTGAHPDAARFNVLADDLVPAADNCETLEGEFLRAASRIHYDLFNNGWGCNNWSGAVVFLKTYIQHLPKLDMNLLDKVHAYSHGEPVPRYDLSWDAKYKAIVTAICEGVIQSITDVRTPNTVDMFDFQESEFREFDEEEDEEAEGEYYEDEEE